MGKVHAIVLYESALLLMPQYLGVAPGGQVQLQNLAHGKIRTRNRIYVEHFFAYALIIWTTICA